MQVRLLTEIRATENHHIMKTSLFKYTENFTIKKWKISDKNPDIFRISALNIDLGTC